MGIVIEALRNSRSVPTVYKIHERTEVQVVSKSRDTSVLQSQENLHWGMNQMGYNIWEM